MYCSHFGLHRPPFNNTPDPSFYYSTPDHEEALATLQYATINRKGFVLVTGEVGAGKTLIGRMFIRQVDRQASTAVITHTQLNARQLLAAICAEFELEVPADATNLQLADVLQEYLLDQFARDRFVVVLLDEAQNLPDESFEALRMLGNLEADDAKLLQVCILGQPELRERFKSESMRQLDQRLFRRFHLEGLTQHQMTEYIQRRLSVAGCPRTDLFTVEALERIYRGSQGIPRLINRVCDNALLAAYAQTRETVDAAIVDQVLEQEGLANPPADQETEARIEQIYGTVPVVTDACGVPAELQQSGEAVRQVVMEWPTLKRDIEEHRLELQRSLDEATNRCRRAEEQFIAAARGSAPVEAVEELRRLHNEQTGRVLAEIKASNESVQTLAQQTETQLSETESRLKRMQASSADKQDLERLEQRQDRLLHEALNHLEQHRHHVQHLVKLLTEQNEETRAGLAAVSQSQSEWQSALAQRLDRELTREAAARAEDVQTIRATQQALRAEWAEQLDRSLGELDAKLSNRVAATAAATDIDKIRDAQTAVRDELSRDFKAHLADLQTRLREQIEAKASTEQLQSVRRDQVRLRKTIREDVQGEISQVRSQVNNTVETARGEIEGRLARTKGEIEGELVRTRDALQGEVANTRNELQAELRQSHDKVAGEVAHTRNELQTELRKSHDEVAGKVAQAQSELQSEVSQTREALGGRLAETRNELQSELARTRDSLEDEVRATRQELEGRADQTRTELHGAVSQTRGELRQEVEQVRDDLGRRIDSSAEGLDRLSSALDGLRTDHRESVEHHAEELGDQATAIEDLFVSVGRHEDEIRRISHEADARHDALIRGLDELRADSPGLEQVQRLRDDHDRFAREALDRFAEKEEALAALKESLESRLADSAGRHDAAVAELSQRVEAETTQVRQLRRRLIQSYAAISKRFDSLDERYADRTELETLRRVQSEQAGALLERIQADRHAVETMIEQLSERFRATHQRLDGLAADAESDGADLAELRRVQAEDVASLLRQLEDQRRLSQEQFERSLAQWTQSQSEIAELRALATDTSALEELRRRQERDSQTMLHVLDEQRQNLETLICGANDRCDAMLARLDALPANVASTGDVQALHEESRENKAALEGAIRAVADQCDRTAEALRSLQDRAAGVDSDIEQIRQDHAQNLDEIVQRLDGQSNEYQQEFDALKDRWNRLRSELHSLAGSTTPVKKFEATERLINRDMSQLKQRLDDVASRRRKDLKVLVDVVQRLNERVKQLEELDRPEPVRLELRPRAAEELAALNSSAENNVTRLQTLLGQTETVGDQLRDSSGRVEQVMREWVEQANGVRAQSDQLRTSAAASAGILKAMRTCHDAIDNKLKSAAWHGQLRRGEEVTARLEQVLPKFQEFEETVHAWQQERGRAEALVQHLEGLIAEAARATSRLGRVGALMAGVAGKNGVAQAVESARDQDEQARPTRGNGRRRNQGGDVEVVAWPRYNTHMNAG